MSARCYVISDPATGQPVATVRADRPPSDADVAAVRELAAVVRRRMANRPINDQPHPRPPGKPLPPPTKDDDDDD